MNNMEQHPLPQDITAYRFRLVGSMTLKQFLELAGGAVIAWLIFSSGLNFLIKWTLAPMIAFFGFALAFIPIEDRPLDQWILNFFKAIYQPTQFVYKPEPKQPEFMAPLRPHTTNTNTAAPANPEQMENYLKSLPGSPTTAFDVSEQKYLEYIHSLFGAFGTKIVPKMDKASSQPLSPAKTIRGVRVRKLLHPQMCMLPHASLYQAPAEPTQASMPHPSTIAQGRGPSSITQGYGPPPGAQGKPAAKTVAAVKPVAKVAPKTKAVAKPAPYAKPAEAQTTVTSEAVFAKDLVLPQPPDKPNLIAGITLDEKGKILPNVILEIKDSKGLPVRALKSNKLGQFFIATPLNEGIYQIAAEIAGKRFAIIKLEAKGEIIPPLKIQAQA